MPARLRGPLTRSAIKPRLLFPTAEQLAAKARKSFVTDDEEAITDIEEESHEMSTPAKNTGGSASTPKAPRFAPASPPSTLRATRSKKIDDFSSPATSVMFSDDDDDVGPVVGRARGGKVSPFDTWQRTKNTSQTKKRMGDSIMRSGGDASKRQRGQAA